MDWLQPASGFIVGCLVGLTGMGGGSLMTAMLILVLGVHPLTAVGTDLIYASVTKLVGTAAHARNKNVDWRIARRLAAGSIPAALIVVALLSAVPHQSPRVGSIITVAIGAALVLAAAAIFFRKHLLGYAAFELQTRARDRLVAVRTIALGALIGALVAFSSVGAGAVGLVALLFLYPKHTAVRLVGTDIAHAVPLTIVAGLGHALIGTVDWRLLFGLLLGSLPGIYVGSLLATRIPERILLPALALLLFAIGVRLVAS